MISLVFCPAPAMGARGLWCATRWGPRGSMSPFSCLQRGPFPGRFAGLWPGPACKRQGESPQRKLSSRGAAAEPGQRRPRPRSVPRPHDQPRGGELLAPGLEGRWQRLCRWGTQVLLPVFRGRRMPRCWRCPGRRARILLAKVAGGAVVLSLPAPFWHRDCHKDRASLR